MLQPAFAGGRLCVRLQDGQTLSKALPRARAPEAAHRWDPARRASMVGQEQRGTERPVRRSRQCAARVVRPGVALDAGPDSGWRHFSVARTRGTSPLPLPATREWYAWGGWEEERAGATWSENAPAAGGGDTQLACRPRYRSPSPGDRQRPSHRYSGRQPAVRVLWSGCCPRAWSRSPDRPQRRASRLRHWSA